MKIAMLGGSFNPVHIGHLALADDVCTSCGYDKIIFVPVFRPPHKEMNSLVSADERLAMLKLAVKDDRRFSVDDCEIRRGDISYTIDTVLYLQKKYSNVLDGKIGLIIGQEIAGEFYKWNRASEIASLTEIIIARRKFDSLAIDTAEFENKPSGAYTGDCVSDSIFSEFEYPHINLENPVLPVSSTEIRARINSSLGYRYLVPSRVFQYINRRKLYK